MRIKGEQRPHQSEGNVMCSPGPSKMTHPEKSPEKTRESQRRVKAAEDLKDNGRSIKGNGKSISEHSNNSDYWCSTGGSFCPP